MKIYPCNNYSKLQKNWAGWWGYFDEWKPQYKDYNQTKVKQNYLQIIATCSFIFIIPLSKQIRANCRKNIIPHTGFRGF